MFELKEIIIKDTLNNVECEIVFRNNLNRDYSTKFELTHFLKEIYNDEIGESIDNPIKDLVNQSLADIIIKRVYNDFTTVLKNLSFTDPIYDEITTRLANPVDYINYYFSEEDINKILTKLTSFCK